MKSTNHYKTLPCKTADLRADAPERGRPAALSARAGAVAVLVLLAACAAPRPPLPPPHIGSFGDFSPPAAQPHYLACPENYCLASPDEVTPLIAVPADRMRGIVRHALDAQPQAALVSTDNEGLRLVYRQGLPSGASVVTIDIVDADDGASGLAIYSQSETGDRAADRALVRRLLDAITRAAQPVEHRAG
jgi:hypothetical protein